MPVPLLTETTTALRVIGLNCSEERLEAIDKASNEHGAYVRTVLEMLPSFILRTVADTITATAKKTEGEALSVLNKRGVLGLGIAKQIARLLLAIRKRRNRLERKNHILSVADEELTIETLVGMISLLKGYEPLWGQRATALVLHADTHQRFGSLPRVGREKVLAVEVASEALLPAGAAEMRWVRVYPLPSGLQHSDPGSELRARTVLVPPDDQLAISGDTTLDREQVDAVLYAGLIVSLSLLTREWYPYLRLSLKLSPEPGYRTHYDSKMQRITIHSDPSAVWDIVHEIAHAIDDQLVPGFDVLASETPDNPIAAFVDVVRPLYRPVVEERSRTHFDEVVGRKFGPAAERMKWGLVSLDIVMEHADWLTPENKTSLKTIFQSEGIPTRKHLEEVLGRPISRVEETLLVGIAENAAVDDQGGVWLDIEQVYPFWRHRYLTHALSNAEVFARFFDQYARMYWNQLGHPYGFEDHLYDLDPQLIATHAPDFLNALLRAQMMNIAHRRKEHQGSYIEGVAISGILAATMIGIGAEIIEPPK
jgi:hypothetical protein